MSDPNKCVSCAYAKLADFKDATDGAGCRLVEETVNLTYGSEIDCGLAAAGLMLAMGREVNPLKFGFMLAVAEQAAQRRVIPEQP